MNRLANSGELAGDTDGGLSVTGAAGSASRWRFRRLEFDASLQKSPWWTPIASVILALIACGIFIASSGMNPFTVYHKMLTGAFGSTYGLTETTVKAIPLLLCGLGVTIAYRISVWNIGAEGQFVAGAMAAAAVTVYFPDLPGYLTIPLMFLFSISAGALWGLMTAIPKTHFQVNELITSLMLNYIALLALDYVVFGTKNGSFCAARNRIGNAPYSGMI